MVISIQYYPFPYARDNHIPSNHISADILPYLWGKHAELRCNAHYYQSRLPRGCVLRLAEKVLQVGVRPPLCDIETVIGDARAVQYVWLSLADEEMRRRCPTRLCPTRTTCCREQRVSSRLPLCVSSSIASVMQSSGR